MGSVGVKHDRSGWMKGEAGFSYDRSWGSDGNLTETYLPMAQFRWSIDRETALSGRWDGYWSSGGGGTSSAQALTVFASRYLPTRTALHLFTRIYRSDQGVESVSPSVEAAQYVRWNLTLRVTYRFYRNWFDAAGAPPFIEGGSLTSGSARAYVEWQVKPGVKVNVKLRNYVSDQDIRMNTYLAGLEWEI
jgi:hypothetical protein